MIFRIGITRKLTTNVMIIAPIILRKNPTRAMSGILKYPLPNIIAFGGVATGNMKAHDADIVAGIMKRYGWILVATASAANTGIIIVVVAVLDVTSVRKVKRRQIQSIMKIVGTPERNDSLSPIHWARPEL